MFGASEGEKGHHARGAKSALGAPFPHMQQKPMGWKDPYFCEWGKVVGDRIRRLRRARGLTLNDFRELVWKPEGGWYSEGYFSRLERGWASAPLYVYLSVAEALGVEPGALLGPDEATRAVTGRELTVVRLMRRLQLEPEDVLELFARGLPAPPGHDADQPSVEPDEWTRPAEPARARRADEQIPAVDRQGLDY